ncbi:MAG: YkgJ family cysteine cluster protein [Chitinispirillaceae bacterium]
MGNTIRERNCVHCEAACCRHVTLPIEKPTCKRDYDNIRWYLMHKDVTVMVDHWNEWLISFKTICEKLNDSHRCIDYDNRPNVCRKYPEDDQYCEYETDDPVYKILFTNAHEFESYLEKKNIHWRWKRK